MQLEATLPSGVKKSFSDGNIRLFSRLPHPPTQDFVLQTDWLPSNNSRTSHFHFPNLTFTFLCRSGSHDTEPGLETIQVLILVYQFFFLFFSSSSFQNLSVAFQRFWNIWRLDLFPHPNTFSGGAQWRGYKAWKDLRVQKESSDPCQTCTVIVTTITIAIIRLVKKRHVCLYWIYHRKISSSQSTNLHCLFQLLILYQSYNLSK